MPVCFQAVTSNADVGSNALRLAVPGAHWYNRRFSGLPSRKSVPTQRWKVVVARLGASTVLHDSEVEAANWMGALRAVRQAMAERPNLPPGASCSMDENGITTVLDPVSRRKFVLTPVALGTVAPEPAPAAPEPPIPSKAKRFQTVAMVPEQLKLGAPTVALPTKILATAQSAAVQPVPHSTAVPVPEPAIISPIAATAPTTMAIAAESPAKKKRFQTVAFTDAAHMRQQGTAPSAAAVPVAAPAATAPSPPVQSMNASSASPIGQPPVPHSALELLLERNEDANAESPLIYRERAYVLAKGSNLAQAEAAVREVLAGLRQELDSRPRGKLVNLAVFDHRWIDAPLRPPLIVLQWRDWRGDVSIEYPAAAHSSLAPTPSAPPNDDRLADVFEALEELSHLSTPVDGLDLAVRLLESTIPSEATSACMYDINTDQLRFVAVLGTGAAAAQGNAVGRSAGLFGQAARAEHHASVFADVHVEPAFDVAVDSRPGLQPRNVMVRPIIHEHQLLGMLQLVNRQQADGFSIEDTHVINYIGERLADFLFGSRALRKSQPPATRRR